MPLIKDAVGKPPLLEPCNVVAQHIVGDDDHVAFVAVHVLQYRRACGTRVHLGAQKLAKLLDLIQPMAGYAKAPGKNQT